MPGPPAVTRRTREKGDWRQTFLTHLARMGNVSLAAKAAGIGRSFAYTQREADTAFAAAWDAALDEAADAMEAEAWRRAVKGVRRAKGVYYEGKQIATETVTDYSDTLLIFMLKAVRPEKFRERSDLRVSGDVGFKVYEKTDDFDPDSA